MVSEGHGDEQVAARANALRLEDGLRRLTADLRPHGADVLVLKGPPTQRRLTGTRSIYRSTDLDVLVRGLDATRTRRVLERCGWEFSPVNGRLWRYDGAAAFASRSAQIDVHWGLHVGMIPARRLAPLSAAMWREATPTAGGWFEPAIVPLAAYLVLHTADRMGSVAKRRLAQACVDRLDEPGRQQMLDLTAQCGMRHVAVRALLSLEQDDQNPIDVLALANGPARAALTDLVRRRLPGWLQVSRSRER